MLTALHGKTRWTGGGFCAKLQAQDKSALSSSALPMVPYSSKSIDITENVIKELNTGRKNDKK